MPVYTYRREDGTTFDIKQGFNENPLTVDPATGQRVVRIVQQVGVTFKGSGFYVNDSKSKSSTSLTNGNGKHADSNSKTESKSDSSSESKAPVASTEAAAD